MSGVLRFDQLDTGRQAKIRANLAQMESQHAPQEDIESYLRDVEHIAPAGSESEPVPHGSGRVFGQGAPRAGILQTAFDAIPFVTKTEAAVDAGVNRVTGGGTRGYEQNLLNRRAGIDAFREQHPKQALASTIAGAALPVLATMGGAAPEEGALLAPKASLLSRLVSGSAEGAAYGGLQGASEAHGSLQDYQDKIQQGLLFGGAAGAAGTALSAGVGAVARKVGIPRLVSNTAASLAARTESGGTANRYLTKLASAFGAQGEASTLVGQRQAADRMAGFAPGDMPNQVPMLAIDRAGPATEQLAQGVAHGPAGPGQASLVRNLTRRATSMKPSITDAIEAGTGVAPQQGMEPLRQLIQQQGNEADRLYSVARKATEGQPVQSQTLDAVMQTPVGRQAYSWAAAQKANRLSPMPVANPELEANVATANAKSTEGLAGSARYGNGTLRPPHLVSDEGLLQELEDLSARRVKSSGDAIYEFTPDENFHTTTDGRSVMHASKGPVAGVSRQAAAATNLEGYDRVEQRIRDELVSRGHTDDSIDQHLIDQFEREPPTPGETPAPAPAGGGQPLPDPETLHYMKQYLANVARMGIRDGAEGKLATQAQGAVSVWGMIRNELPQPWRQADEAFANKAKMIDAMNQGRNVFRTQVNPAGRARKAVNTSLDALEQRTANAPPDVQQATRTGVGMAAQDRAAQLGTSVKSPGRIFGGEANAQRMALGFNDPEKAQQFQRIVAAWDQIQGQNQRILGNSATGGRVAEQASRAPDQATTSFFRELVHGNFGRALSTVGGQASSAAEKAHRVEADKAIAGILTSRNPNALDEARLTALLRLRLTGTAGKLLPRLAGSEASAGHTPQ